MQTVTAFERLGRSALPGLGLGAGMLIGGLSWITLILAFGCLGS